MILPANNIHRKAGVATLISDKIDIKITRVTKDRDRHFIMIKETIYQEDIIRLNVQAPSQGALKYIKQLLTELKGETGKNIIIVGDLNIPLAALDRSSKQKISREILALNDILYQMDIFVIYRAFHFRTSDYTFFPSVQRTFSWMDNTLCHKTSLNKF